MPDPDLPDLPVQSHQAALPYLRRPYLGTQIRAKIQSAPENPHSPVTIALYAKGETMMDRFNLICGSDWDHSFETLTQEQATGRKTLWYCKVRATITALGKTESDIGDGWGSTQAAAEMNANAQAGKRAGRWHGPGQCLYAADDILMWRDGEGQNKLRLPKSGDDRHLKPYFDEEGVGQGYCRDRYEQWLKVDGESVYGAPLDHLALARFIQNRLTVVTVAIPRSITEVPPADTAHPPTGNGHDHASALAIEPQQPTETASSPEPESKYGPMRDDPPPPAIAAAAESAKYGPAVAQRLSNLARTEGQESKLTKTQLQAVTHWLETLSDLEAPEDAVLKAIAHNATKPISQERRQATFAKWLAGKASGTHDVKSGTPASGPETSSDSEPESGDEPDAANNGLSAVQRAIAVLHRTMTDHSYEDRAVTRFAALATGGGPRTHVTWVDVDPGTLLILADLLDTAASVGWSNEQLEKEVLAAHSSAKQKSTAGRFNALANRITDLSESRAMEPA